MTMVQPIEQRCALCDTPNEVLVLLSAFYANPPDLDSRTPTSARWDTVCYAHRCSACGYCAAHIGQAPEGAAELIQSPAYLAQLHDATLPEEANTFLCAAMVSELAGDLAQMANQTLLAAWACDDAQMPAAAVRLRRLTLARMTQARDAGQPCAPSGVAEAMMMADVARRAGQFDAASRHAQEAAERNDDPYMARVIALERELIADGDTAAHMAPEATQ